MVRGVLGGGKKSDPWIRAVALSEDVRMRGLAGNLPWRGACGAGQQSGDSRKAPQTPPPLLSCDLGLGCGRVSEVCRGGAHARKHTPDPVPAFDCISTFPRRPPSVSAVYSDHSSSVCVFLERLPCTMRRHTRTPGITADTSGAPPVEPAISALMPGERLRGGWSWR